MEVLKTLTSIQLSLGDLNKRVEYLLQKVDGTGSLESVGEGMPCELPITSTDDLLNTLENWVQSKPCRIKLVCIYFQLSSDLDK